MHQREAFQKTMPKHWHPVARTVAARNIKALTHRHQVNIQVFLRDLLGYSRKFALNSTSEKASLLSRLFRRSGRSKQRQIETYSAQFPPAEWFNSKAVHLHSVGTQTSDLVSNADMKFEEICFDCRKILPMSKILKFLLFIFGKKINTGRT